MNAVVSSSSWPPYRHCELGSYRFLQAAFDRFFCLTDLSSLGYKDTLAADSAVEPRQQDFFHRPLPGRARERHEGGLGLSLWNASVIFPPGYLTTGFKEDCPVPADLLKAAFHCLDWGLRTVREQFSRFSLLPTFFRRANVLDALSPSWGHVNASMLSP